MDGSGFGENIVQEFSPEGVQSVRIVSNTHRNYHCIALLLTTVFFVQFTSIYGCAFTVCLRMTCVYYLILISASIAKDDTDSDTDDRDS